VAFIASGTATLEASIMRTPMVIVYKVSPISYIFGKFLIHVRNVGLVNLVADKEIVPELIQGDATAENLAKEGIAILENRVVRERIKADLSRVNKKLGKGGAAIKTASIAAKMMGLVG